MCCRVKFVRQATVDAPSGLNAAASGGIGDGSKPFDQMNTIAAHLLTNLTWCDMCPHIFCPS